MYKIKEYILKWSYSDNSSFGVLPILFTQGEKEMIEYVLDNTPVFLSVVDEIEFISVAQFRRKDDDDSTVS